MATDARAADRSGSRPRRDVSRPGATRRGRVATPTGATGADEPVALADPVTMRLDGRVALVTGAGSADGIGYATARRLVDLGARVAIVSTTRRIHERAGELGVTGFVADLTDESEVGALADAVAEQLGDVEVLVNNAGLASRASQGVLRPVAQLTYDEWRGEIDRNLSTAFLCSRAFIGGMAERGWGRIVNLAATAGPVNALPTEAAYAAAKAGVVGLTRSMAVEWGPFGVAVNAVAPGVIATEMSGDLGPLMRDVIPLRRLGEPEEVAGLVAFLCGPDGGYVSGQTIEIAGGLTDLTPPIKGDA
jgi:3-oxoacyl-[acyl-carrier protein] reductase